MLHVIAYHHALDNFMMIVLLLNITVMAMVYYGQSALMINALAWANLAFTLLFLVEMAIKVAGMGWKPYISYGWNVFDFIVVSKYVTLVILQAI